MPPVSPILKPGVGVSSFLILPTKPSVSYHSSQQSELPGSFEVSPLDTEAELQANTHLLQGYLPGSSVVLGSTDPHDYTPALLSGMFGDSKTISTWVCRGWDRAGNSCPVHPSSTFFPQLC